MSKFGAQGHQVHPQNGEDGFRAKTKPLSALDPPSMNCRSKRPQAQADLNLLQNGPQQEANEARQSGPHPKQGPSVRTVGEFVRIRNMFVTCVGAYVWNSFAVENVKRLAQWSLLKQDYRDLSCATTLHLCSLTMHLQTIN